MPDVENEIKKAVLNFWDKMTTAIMTSLGIVLALAWNDAIKSLFDKYVGIENIPLAKFLYALVLTVVVVVLSLYFVKKGDEQNKEKAEEKK